jgi:drug/metabolite transporter (DMT)-like permease
MSLKDLERREAKWKNAFYCAFTGCLISVVAPIATIITHLAPQEPIDHGAIIQSWVPLMLVTGFLVIGTQIFWFEAKKKTNDFKTRSFE